MTQSSANYPRDLANPGTVSGAGQDSGPHLSLSVL